MQKTHPWLALSILVLAQFMIVLDVSIMNVALPSIERTFSLGVDDLQWIVTAYTLLFGGFLLLGGRAADLYGRRRVFLAGVGGFTLVSLIIGFTQSSTELIVLRALQGFCAAFMSPAALSLLLSIFHGPERTRALSLWGAVSAGGATAGILLGGLLTQYLNWRWNFFVNVPVGLFVVFAALRLLPAHTPQEESKNLDLPGAILATSGLMLLVYTLSHARGWGWDSALTLGLLFLAAALFVLFVWNESRATHPLVPLSIFRVGNIAAADLVQLPITASLFSMFFFLSLYVQNVLGYTPLQSGFAFLPTTLTVGISAILAPRVIQRVGYKPILVCAPLLLACGLLTFAQLPIDGAYLDILPGMLMMAVGLGASFVSVSVAATTGVPLQESGLASGLLSTAQQIGGSLGLALLSSVAASSAALYVSSHAPGALLQVEATVAGFHSAFLVGASFALLASLIALFFIRPLTPTHQPVIALD